MLSRFHLILERNGQTDGRTDLLHQYQYFPTVLDE